MILLPITHTATCYTLLPLVVVMVVVLQGWGRDRMRNWRKMEGKGDIRRVYSKMAGMRERKGKGGWDKECMGSDSAWMGKERNLTKEKSQGGWDIEWRYGRGGTSTWQGMERKWMEGERVQMNRKMEDETGNGREQEVVEYSKLFLLHCWRKGKKI